MPKLSKRRFAITGTIGSGKSTVTSIIAKTYPSISADQIVADLYDDKTFAKMINQKFLNNEKEIINKADLSKVIFDDDKAKQALEAIIHPLVKKNIIDWLKKQKEMCFVEVPLLFEAKFDHLFDEIILVVAKEKIIIKRLKENRNQSSQKTKSIIAKQMDEDKKIKKSDYIIENNKDLKTLEKEVNKLLKHLESGD